MAFNFQEMLKDRRIVLTIAGVVGVLLLIIVISLVLSIASGGNKNSSSDNSSGKRHPGAELLKEDVELLSTDNMGKALEIQALLAKEGIRAERAPDGSKSKLVLRAKKATMDDRDNALIAIVKSGYMDQNIGLEIFDKGDFTSTKEDKKIRLSRAVNGELSRLIRKFDEVENASVFVSIPEQTLYKSEQKPITATVQLVIKNGERLPDIKVRAIQNLLLGSIQGLDSSHISITDTNGNVYNSIIGAEDDIIAKMQENDQYMSKKVQSQLDKLVGNGNYVVTVSTQLREVPLEKTSLKYDPDEKTAISEQIFSEGLGDQTADTSKGLNAVSTYAPLVNPAGATSSAQSRKYARTAKETQYGISKTQTSEYYRPGVVEEISIAVTLDQKSLPAGISIDELKMLIASAASPKASAENVTIAFSEGLEPFLAEEKSTTLPKPAPSGNPIWLPWLLGTVVFVMLFFFLSSRLRAESSRQTQEMEEIKARAMEQEKQLQDVNLKAAELIERQTQLAQNMIEVKTTAEQAQQNQQIPQNTYQNPALPEIMDTIADIAQDVDEADESDFASEMQSWIERT